MTRILTSIFGVLLLSIVSFSSTAQQRPILLKNGTVQLERNAEQFAQELIPFANTFNGVAYKLMQFDHVLLNEEKSELLNAGFEILEYIPHYAYVISFPVSADRSLVIKHGAVSVIEMGPAFKVNAALHAPPYPAHVVQGKWINVLFQTHKNVHFNEVEHLLNGMGARVETTGPSKRLLRGWIPHNKIAFFGSLPFLSQLEFVAEPGVPEALDGKSLHRSTKINSSYAGGLDFDGEGVSIAINDDGFVGPHIDFTGRVDQSDVAGDLTGDHGDMTAGIAGGAGNLDPTVPGMAPGCFIWVRQYSGSLPNVISMYQNDGVLAFSSSYSNGCNAGYTGTTQQVDDEIFNNTEIFQSFSAGNSNNNDCGYGAGNQWGNITGGHKIAKNVTAAANLRYNEVIETSSSRGPASDGRIKPDISAHGTGHLSTDPNNVYSPGGGTSAACPGITGCYAQLVQAHRELTSGGTPESGLIKACMLNTAYDLGNVGPDFIFGWGRVNTEGAYNILEKNQYLLDQINQGDNNTQTITVPAGTDEFRVMLYWMDPPASTASFKALVNDLDLTATDPTGANLQPWVLDPTPSPSLLNLPAAPGIDTLNNVEQILVTNPVAGTYTLNISGTEVPMGPQNYYIVWEFFGGVDLAYPIGGEGLPPGEDVRILWDAVGNTGTFQLEYTIDGGTNWSPIATVAGDQRFFENWVVPNVISGDVRVRVTRGSDSDMSDADLSIMEQPDNLNIVRVCPTEIRLAWDSVPGATSYTIHQLGAKFMDSIATATTQIHDLTVADVFDDFWWAVTAHGPNGVRSRRAIASYYDGSGLLNCSQNDELSATDILSPFGLQAACYGVDSIITVRIANNGLLNQTGFPVGYSVNNTAPVIETFTGTLASGTNAIYTFNTPIAFTGASQYDIKAWSDLSSDALITNDTAYGTLSVIAVNNIPNFNEDFESFSNCSTADDCGATVCPLGSKWYNATNGTEDDIDWRVDASGTPSNGTGPSIDHAPGTSQGKYVYTEASNGCNAQEAHLVSACVDFAGVINPGLSLWYHMDGGAMGSIHVDVYDGTNWVLDVAPAISGDQGTAWQEWVVDLSAYANILVSLRVRGITGPGFESDLALDDINVLDLAQAPVAAFDADKYNTCVGDTITLTDASAFLPTSWSWSITPSNFVFVNGTNANSPNPQIVFNTGGTFNVQLDATNAFGTGNASQVIQQDAAGSTVNLDFTLDRFGAETTWAILDGTNVVKSGGPYSTQAVNGEYPLPTITLCLPDDICLVLEVYDSFGDGICCGSGNGFYVLTNSFGDTLVNGDGSFGPVGSTPFCPDVNSISENELAGLLNLLPNPNDGQMTLSFGARISGKVVIEVYSVSGAQVYSEQLLSPEGDERLDMGQLSEGVYSMRVKTSTASQVMRFVIQR